MRSLLLKVIKKSKIAPLRERTEVLSPVLTSYLWAKSRCFFLSASCHLLAYINFFCTVLVQILALYVEKCMQSLNQPISDGIHGDFPVLYQHLVAAEFEI